MKNLIAWDGKFDKYFYNVNKSQFEYYIDTKTNNIYYRRAGSELELWGLGIALLPHMVRLFQMGIAEYIG